MQLANIVRTFGSAMLEKHGQKVHKLALNAGFNCPNRDGSVGIGGCTFCNNASFNPAARNWPGILQQICNGKQVIRKRTGAQKYIAYFQAYTNTYAHLDGLKRLYDEALSDNDVIGLSVGTRPDCVPESVLQLLADYQDAGFEVWLELGLQSAFDNTLKNVNRGHGLAEYIGAVKRAHRYNLQVCTHLIVGLPGESSEHCLASLKIVLDLGVEGVKFHPLHVVKGTQLANQWRRGEYTAMTFDEYIETAVHMVKICPSELVFHRLTATAEPRLLLAPSWCAKKWHVLNSICQRLTTTCH